jgi:hypothetical protein
MEKELRASLRERLTQRGQAAVGRVLSWLRDPHKRLPVSCTVYAVRRDWDDVLYSWRYVSAALRHGAGCAVNLEDYAALPAPCPCGRLHLHLDLSHPDAAEALRRYGSAVAAVPPVSSRVVRVADTMDEEVSGGYYNIEASWAAVAEALRAGEDVWVDLSALRPKDSDNGRGLVASGPVSFAEIYRQIAAYVAEPSLVRLCQVYSRINEVLRRGGTYRNGAVTLYVHYRQLEAAAFLAMQREELEWAKRALTVDEGLLRHPLLPQVLEGVAVGDLFLAKPRYGPDGERLYSQVCMEIALRSRDTCTLHHVNLGALLPEEIPAAFEVGMEALCELHRHNGVEQLGIYLAPQESRQVGLGVLGLANFLALQRLTYAQFTQALQESVALLAEHVQQGKDIEACWQERVLRLQGQASPNLRAHLAAAYLVLGYWRAAAVARRYGLERAFTIAPTATSAFQHRDAQGFVTAPNIAPPIARSVLRDSQEFGLLEADYHPYVEIAEEVGFEIYFRLACAWQQLMELTGLAHAISFDLWDQQPITAEFLQRWLDSPLWTTYYRTRTLGLDVVDKSRIDSACLLQRPGECEPCAG